MEPYGGINVVVNWEKLFMQLHPFSAKAGFKVNKKTAREGYYRLIKGSVLHFLLLIQGKSVLFISCSTNLQNTEEYPTPVDLWKVIPDLLSLGINTELQG